MDLEPSNYRDLGKPPREKLSFFEALSFSIASTWATRKPPETDAEKSDAMKRAIGYGLVYFFTHKFRG